MDFHCADNFKNLNHHHENRYGCGRNIERYEPQVNTSSLYKTYNLPERFENTRKYNTLETDSFRFHWTIVLSTDIFRGFGIQRKNLCLFYRTTSLDYGWYTPSPHTVPLRLNKNFLLLCANVLSKK